MKAIQTSLTKYSYLTTLVGGMAARLATLAILILLPSHIGLVEYGLFVLVITLGEIVEMTTSNWYRIVLVRQSVNETESPAESRGLAKRRPVRFPHLVAGLGLLALLAAACIAPFFSTSADAAAFTAATMAYVFCFLLFKLLVAVLQAQRKQQLIGVVELLRGFMMIAFVAMAIYGGSKTFFLPAIGLAAAALIAAAAALLFARSGFWLTLGQALRPGAFVKIGVPLIIATLLTFQLGWIDRLVIQKLMGPEMVGLYVAIAAIARQPIELVLHAMNTQTFPVMMERNEIANRGARQRAASILLSACILGFGGAAAIIAMAQPLVRAVLPAFDPVTAELLLAPLAIGAAMLGVKSFVFDNIFHAHGEQWRMLKWFTIVSFLSLLGAVVGILHFGVIGAGYAFLAGSVLALIASILVSRQVWRFTLPALPILKVIASATLAAIAARYATTPLLETSAWLAIASGSATFAAFYFAGLAILLRFNFRRFIAAPWETYHANGGVR